LVADIFDMALAEANEEPVTNKQYETENDKADEQK